jgi:prevent-host-death family protein
MIKFATGGVNDVIQIRPVSDLRNKYSEIESTVSEGQAVFLTKNGYGSMVVMSLEKYSEMTNDIESKLDHADHVAAFTDIRYAHEDVFSRLNEGLDG